MVYEVCVNDCPRYVPKGDPSRKCGCPLMSPSRSLYNRIRRGDGCPNDPPLFGKHEPVEPIQPKEAKREVEFKTGGVGFIVAAHLKHGGTEAWHRTLLPRMTDVAGMVVTSPELAKGSPDLVGCPIGVGVGDARRLAEQCHTVVVWGIGSLLSGILQGLKNRPRVISVSHCDDRSKWTIDYMSKQAAWTDQAVYLCPSGLKTVPKQHRKTALFIPNAPDPTRIATNRNRDDVRRELGIKSDQIMLLVVSRISPEKRIKVLARAISYLPERFVLVIAGPPNAMQPDCAAELSAMAGDRIKILPPVDPPADLILASDAILSASTYEGYGLSMAEGILAGKPLIATKTGLLESHPQSARIVKQASTAR